MGTYVYSMRKRLTRIQFVDEPSVAANGFRYAYKEWSDRSYDDATEAGRDRIRNRTVRTGSEAFVASPARVAICGDVEDGAEVYADVTSGTWIDTESFPGRLVGWLRRVRLGNRFFWTVVDATRWEPVTVLPTTGPAYRWRRLALYDGAAVEEFAPRLYDQREPHWHIAGQRPVATVWLKPEARPVY